MENYLRGNVMSNDFLKVSCMLQEVQGILRSHDIALTGIVLQGPNDLYGLMKLCMDEGERVFYTSASIVESLQQTVGLNMWTDQRLDLLQDAVERLRSLRYE